MWSIVFLGLYWGPTILRNCNFGCVVRGLVLGSWVLGFRVLGLGTGLLQEVVNLNRRTEARA